MVFLIWQKKWDLDIPEMDQQHTALVKKLNQLAEVLSQMGQGNAAEHNLDEMLNDLLSNTRAHFVSEENLMRQFDYPGLSAHHREHAILLAELKVLIAEIKQGKTSLDLNTLSALKHWFVAHLIGADRDYATSYHATKR